MKHSAVLPALLLCSFALPAMAQNRSTVPAATKPASNPTQPAHNNTLTQVLEARTSLELSEVNATTALIQLLKTTKVSYDFAPEFYQFSPGRALQLPPNQLTLRLQNVSLSKALNTLTRSIGIRWSADEEEGQVTVHFLPPAEGLKALYKRLGYHGPGIDDTEGGLGGFGGGSVGGGFGGAGGGIGSGGFGGGIPLPSNRVKLDSHDALVRDSLKSILQQAKLEFALDEDISPTDKRSNTFENVTITTALNVICESAGLGWRAEPLSNGILIRVSKRYAPANRKRQFMALRTSAKGRE